jgi:hypothetical protein
MTVLDVAIIKEPGIDFAVVAVKDHVLLNRTAAEEACTAFGRRLSRPAIIVGEHNLRTYGRPDIVRYLQGYPWDRLP